MRAFALMSGERDLDNHFGELAPGTISGTVFVDGNNDGVQNGNDQGIAGVTIALSGTDVHGSPVTRTEMTAADGSYLFTNLPPGTYTVTEPAQPVDFFDGMDSVNGVTQGSRGTDALAGISLALGGSAVANNFAEVPAVELQGYVYIDANNNGLRDRGEAGLTGAELTLTGNGADVFGDAIPPRTVFTDADGFYRFSGIPPALYVVTETQPNGFLDGAEQNGTPAAGNVTNDQFQNIDLTDTRIAGDFNFGELSPSGSISGAVYVDANNNGMRDPDELGLGGVVVRLVNESDLTTVYTVTTDMDGNYRFAKLFPGSYRLIQRHPTNFLDGQETPGPNGAIVAPERFHRIVVGVNQTASGYLFGEAGINPDRISKRAFLNSTTPATDFTGPRRLGCNRHRRRLGGSRRLCLH